MLYFFSNGCNVTEVCKMLKCKISKKSVIQWFNYFRDVMTCHFANNPVIFQNTVHIDETFIGGKRKYNRGRIPSVKPRYLFGIIDKESHKVMLQFKDRRDFINIIPLITRHLVPGTQINTDGAKVYKKLDQMNYIHNVCIHKEHFVDPQTGNHSNWIEGLWGNLKIKLKSV